MKISMTPPDVARYLGIDAAKVLDWIRDGELKAYNVAARSSGRPRWRIEKEALDEFLRRRQSPVPLAPQPSRRRKNENVTEYF